MIVKKKKDKGDFRVTIYDLRVYPPKSKTVTLYDGYSTLGEMELRILAALGVK